MAEAVGSNPTQCWFKSSYADQPLMPRSQVARQEALTLPRAGSSPAGAATLLLLLFLAIPALAKENYGSVDAVVYKVHDGDTLVVVVKDWPPVIGDRIGVRVYGIDTRELNKGGEVAKRFVQALLSEGAEIVLSDIQRDKYFRILARVGYNCKKRVCQDLSTTLLTEKYAVPYFGETKMRFPKEIK